MREVLHKESGRQYMWSGDPAYWGRVSPVLFPIVGRLKDDQYKIDDQTYQLSQHGFLRDVDFELFEEAKDQVVFQYQSNGRHTSQYPYEFTARISYALSENGLTISWEIVHEGDGTMYFSIGGHPAFHVPLVEGEQTDDYSLTLIPSTEHDPVQYELHDSLVREKEKGVEFEPIQLRPELFQNDAMIFSHIDQVSLTSQAVTALRSISVVFRSLVFGLHMIKKREQWLLLFVLSLGMGSLIWKGQTGSIRRNSAFKP
ncbi:aldose epimerase family protein [Bacillus altitudinis]|uniref:aldose epimerase family protein n=1 Tax=Bacillus altitudinis TaxID=293387 RepID=UPI00211657C7|nr:aldose 1-epimerase family protein [Bacillus altitudinis]UUH74189.1 aldose 1-epimerase family protein [Bacillus altitudinis]